MKSIVNLNFTSSMFSVCENVPLSYIMFVHSLSRVSSVRLEIVLAFIALTVFIAK